MSRPRWMTSGESHGPGLAAIAGEAMVAISLCGAVLENVEGYRQQTREN